MHYMGGVDKLFTSLTLSDKPILLLSLMHRGCATRSEIAQSTQQPRCSPYAEDASLSVAGNDITRFVEHKALPHRRERALDKASQCF